MRNELASEGAPVYAIDSVSNALRSLLYLRGRAEVRVTELGSYLGVAPSTAHRLLATLRTHGFVEQVPGSRAYRLTALIGTFSPGPPDRRRLLQVARLPLVLLSRESGETSNLLVLEGPDVRFLDGVESTSTLRVTPRTGDSLPAHGTAGGKAMLASLTESEVRLLYDGGLAHLTSWTIVDLDVLEADLAVVQERGYATNVNESVLDVGGVGAPIHDRAGQVVAAVTVSGPASRVNDDTAPTLYRLLRRAADSITAQL